MTGEVLGLPGEILGERYQVLRRLGKKAGRQTLLARDQETQQLVVVKLLTFGNEFSWEDLRLFERETETLKTLKHPAIPCYLDSFEWDTPDSKGFALVQNYIQAQSLEEYLSAGRVFSENEVKQLANALSEILTYLHSQKPPVIHRDIKPSNILFVGAQHLQKNQFAQTQTSHPDASPILYLVDFGSVQTLATREGKTVTVVGTYGYMPPEQFGGRAFPASDLYSLGATLIALVTGQYPADLPQKDLRIQFEQAATLSPDFASWLKWLTEPSLESRPTSAQSAREALEKPGKRNDQLISIKQRQPISTLEILWNSLWRSTAIGTIAVMGYASLYSTFIFPGIGTVMGAVIGGYLGLPLAMANGVLVGILTRLCFFPLKSAKLHRRVISFISILFCTAGSIFYFNMMNLGSFNSGPYRDIFWNLVPALIAGLSMGVSSQRIARWYERETRLAEEDLSG